MDKIKNKHAGNKKAELQPPEKNPPDADKRENIDLSDEEKQKAIDSENSVLEEPLNAKKSFKERIKPFFKRTIKENIITPYKEGLKEMD